MRILEPALNFRALVGAGVIHDKVNFLVGWQLLFQIVEEPDKLPAPVAMPAGANDFAIKNVERSEQSGRAMAFVVAGLPLR